MAVTEQPSVEALVERVKKLEQWMSVWATREHRDTLDSLTAALERAERDYAATLELAGTLRERWDTETDRAIAAVARAQKAEVLRAETSTQLTQVCAERDRAKDAAQKAEAVVRLVRNAAERGENEHIRTWCVLALTAHDEPPTGWKPQEC